MKNYYELFEKCIQSNGTNHTYCSKMLKNIIPTKNYEMMRLEEITNISITSNLTIKPSEGEFNSWKIIDKNLSFTNDDAKFYLNSLIEILCEAKYIKGYDLTFNDTDDSLVAFMETTDLEKKIEIYELFNDLPKAFNSRVVTYLS